MLDDEIHSSGATLKRGKQTSIRGLPVFLDTRLPFSYSPPTKKQTLISSLLNMHHDPVGTRVLMTFGAQRFVRTTNKEYEPVLRCAREARLNLARYDYVNH